MSKSKNKPKHKTVNKKTEEELIQELKKMHADERNFIISQIKDEKKQAILRLYFSL